MLCLKVPTQQSWIDAACNDLDQVLLDHAHCEKKAATNAIALLNRYPERTELVREMIALAREEMEHFHAVHEIIIGRGGVLRRDPGDRYAQELHRELRPNEPERFLDQLLVAALIEARSCERFSMLSSHVPDAELSVFYGSLLASEAGHYRVFTDIARTYFPGEEVRARLEELATREAQIVLTLQNDPRMHG